MTSHYGNVIYLYIILYHTIVNGNNYRFHINSIAILYNIAGLKLATENSIKSRTGKPRSEETKSKMRMSMQGAKHPHYRTLWVNNGESRQRIKEEDPIPEGYKIGKGRTKGEGKVCGPKTSE